MDMILLVVGSINITMQCLTRNILFAYFGFACMVIYLLSLIPKFTKFINIIGITALSCMAIFSLYCHSLYGNMMMDYILIAVQSILCVTFLVVTLTMKSKEAPSIEGASVC